MSSYIKIAKYLLDDAGLDVVAPPHALRLAGQNVWPKSR